MSTDLRMLIWSIALTWAQCVIAAIMARGQVGLPALAGNRDGMPELTGWAARAARAHRNILESFALFAALVLTAQVTGRANAMTAVGAELFFWARLVYVPIYLLGFPWVRTVAWEVSVVGMVLIFIRLV